MEGNSTGGSPSAGFPPLAKGRKDWSGGKRLNNNQLKLHLLRGERIGVEGNENKKSISANSNLLRGERIGVEGNLALSSHPIPNYSLLRGERVGVG